MYLLVIVGGEKKFFCTDNLPSSIIWPLYYPGEEKLFCSRLRNKYKLLKQELFHLTKNIEKVEPFKDNEVYALYGDLAMCTQAIRDLEDSLSPYEILIYFNRYRSIEYESNQRLSRIAQKISDLNSGLPIYPVLRRLNQ